MGIDLRRRRSVLVRMNTGGEVLERVRIANDAERLKTVIDRAGENLGGGAGATYGWCWPADGCQDTDTAPACTWRIR